MMNNNSEGKIQIYTGEGKGKTTAAVGLAVRARGHNLKVCYICFHKDHAKYGYGEYKILEKIGVKIYEFAKRHPYFSKDDKEEQEIRKEARKECSKALQFIELLFKENKYDMMILDEIIIALRDGFIKEEEILHLLTIKPKRLELILTGCGAPEKLIQQAHLVSFINNIKHPYEAGVKHRRGIEY